MEHVRTGFPATPAPTDEPRSDAGQPTAARARHAARRRRRHRAPTAMFCGLAVLCAGFGLWVRLWMLAHAGLNSDEAIVGLMADAILHGHFTAFYWGQDYGGVEPYVAAGMFAVFGHSAFVLNLTAALLSAVAAVLAGAVAWTAFQRPGIAMVAGALTWIWPGSAVWNSTREYGFRGATLACGLAVLLAAARMARRRRVSPSGAVVLGLAAGVGWWSSPEIVYLLVPAAVVLGWALATRSLRSPALLAASVGGALIGALPWIVANVHSHLASLHHQGTGSPPSTYAERVDTFFVRTLPMLFGLRVEGAGDWIASPAVGHVLFGLVTIAVLVGIAGLLVRATCFSVAIVAGIVLFPWLYCAFPPTIFWNDGRYGVFLPPLCALAVAGGWPVVLRRLAGVGPGWPRAVPVAAAVVALGTAGASTFYAFTATFQRPGGPLSLSPVGNGVVTKVVATLERHRVTDVVGNYWTAYDIDFESGGRITAATVAQDRIPADNREALASRRAAWLFCGATSTDVATASWQFGQAALDPGTLSPTQFVSLLQAHGIRSTTLRVGDMVAVTPHGVTGRSVLGIVEGHPARG